MTSPEFFFPVPPEYTGTEPSPYWDLVRQHGATRESAVAFICGIGGYTRGHRETFSIEFNVSTQNANLLRDNLWELLCSDRIDVGVTPDDANYVEAKNIFNVAYETYENELWDWGVEDAWEGWYETDSAFEMFNGERVEWRGGRYGRCGKHLCIAECGGLRLDYSTEELEERLTAEPCDEDYVEDSVVRKLFLLCVQNTVDLTLEEIGMEVEYQAAFRLWVSFVEPELEEAVALKEKKARLGGAAFLLREYLLGRFIVPDEGIPVKDLLEFVEICELAGVPIKE